MGWLRRIDRFLVAIAAAGALATLWPATGVAAGLLEVVIKVAIAGLFFLYGVRLHPREALAGLRHWRLHVTVLAFTYLVFPLVGMGLGAFVPAWLGPTLYAGVLFTCLVPSTVQSSINFTSIARGNVAAAVVSASASNLLGVAVTPLLAWGLLSTQGGPVVDPSGILDIVGQILVPFVAGQLSRRWTAAWVQAHPRLRLFDHAVIVAVVYSAFSAGRREAMWTQVTPLQLAVLLGVCVAILALMLTLTWTVARRLGFDRPDAIAIQFCGTKKSLATGLPMAAVLFAGQPLGLIMLPLVIFHQAQLMACGALAARYARRLD